MNRQTIIHLCTHQEIPHQLREIPNPPQKLYRIGTIPIAQRYLAVVGARNYTNYGQEVCQLLIHALAGTSTCIVSGLARGIDAIAHQSALAAGLPTIAIPGSGLAPEVLYPARNRKLAYQIVDSDGALLSEFEPTLPAADWTFPRRNRIMAGLAHAVLVIEAKERSGTLITAHCALDYNRDVFAVPGPITSENYLGTNRLLQRGALAITTPDDLREALGFTPNTDNAQQSLFKTYENCSSAELKIIEILKVKQVTKDILIRESTLATIEANIALSMLEMKGIIEERLGVLWLK